MDLDDIIAAQMSGGPYIVDDGVAEELLATVSDAGQEEELRGLAAICLGPPLELADIDGFEDPDSEQTVPITEPMFVRIKESLHRLYLDPATPKQVLRRVLEAAVRAPEEWQKDAVRTAYASGDREWVLTAVFAMRFLEGFDKQILEAIKNPDEEIHAEAVMAAGAGEVEAAWPHIRSLVEDKQTPKPLLLAAIDAVGNMRPAKAKDILRHLARSKDEDIVDAVEEATMLDEVEDDF
jgi:uncharacterized protein (UPF0147 family)